MHVAPTLQETARFKHFSCPACQGTLEVEELSGVVFYVCRVGHAYSPEEVVAGMEDGIEAGLWRSLRAIDELIAMMRRLEREQPEWAADVYRRAEEAVALRGALEDVIARNDPARLTREQIPPPGDPNCEPEEP